MEKELVTFTNNFFGQLRTVEIDDEPWFVGKDVAKALGYSNSRKALADHVDDEDKGVTKCDTPGGTQTLAVINESGLYSLILSSKLSQARQFKHWVTSEVLPAVRQHGFYATKETVSQFLANPDAMVELLRQVSEERTERLAEQQELQSTKKQLAEAKTQLASVPTHVMICQGQPGDDTTSITELAQTFTDAGYPIGRNQLFSILRKRGYIRPGSCLPTFDAIRSGDLVIVEHPSASGTTYYTTGVTTIGRLRFYDLCDELIAQRKVERR